MDIKDVLIQLSNSSSVGYINETDDLLEKMLSDYCSVSYTAGGSLLVQMNFGKEKTLLIDAHIDEIGFTVTHVSENGFLKVAPVGGIDSRILPGQPVKIWGNRVVKGVFGSVPPHLSGGEETAVGIDELYIDSCISNGAESNIPVGTLVTFDSPAVNLRNDFVAGKSLDNRASVAALYKTAELLQGKNARFNVCFLFSRQEEVGNRGAFISAFEISPDECITVDTTFGNCHGIPETQTGKLSHGPMIGISPVLSKSVTEGLKKSAELISSDIQYEVMSGKTGTNADVISVSKSGIPTGLISIPIRNMHTPTEIVSISDIETTAQVLVSYIISGGGAE